MSDARMKNCNWIVSSNGTDAINVEHATLAVLMDIRDELREMNSRFHATIGCRRFQKMPRHLARIATAVAPTKKAKR